MQYSFLLQYSSNLAASDNVNYFNVIFSLVKMS